MDADLGMIVGTDQPGAFQTNRPETKRRALRTDGNDTDVFHRTDSDPFRASYGPAVNKIASVDR
jgi:hypothetical protein